MCVKLWIIKFKRGTYIQCLYDNKFFWFDSGRVKKMHLWLLNYKKKLKYVVIVYKKLYKIDHHINTNTNTHTKLWRTYKKITHLKKKSYRKCWSSEKVEENKKYIQSAIKIWQVIVVFSYNKLECWNGQVNI